MFISASVCGYTERIDTFEVEHDGVTIGFRSHIITDDNGIRVTLCFGREKDEPWPDNLTSIRIQLDITKAETLTVALLAKVWNRKGGETLLLADSRFDDEDAALASIARQGCDELYPYELHVEIID